MGKHEPDALVFFNHDGSPISPNLHGEDVAHDNIRDLRIS
jgi:hypothetical protein